jgi:hypothetical protein
MLNIIMGMGYIFTYKSTPLAATAAKGAQLTHTAPLMLAQFVSGAAHLLAEPPSAVAALEGLLAGVLQEAEGEEREAELAGNGSREPRVEGGATRSLAVRRSLVQGEV